MPGMRKRRGGSDHQLPSLRDADQPEHPQIPHLWRVRLAHHRDVGAVRCLYGDAPHLHVYLSGLKTSKSDVQKRSAIGQKRTFIFHKKTYFLSLGSEI